MLTETTCLLNRRYFTSRLPAVLALALILSLLLNGVAFARTQIRYVNQNANDGLIAYWSFDENGGTSFRDSANLPAAGSNGVVLPGGSFFGSTDRSPLYEMYFNPSSLELDGVTGMGQVTNAPALNLADAFTVGAWIKRLADNDGGVIYLSGTNAGAWRLGLTPDGRLTFSAGSQVIATATQAIALNQWSYVAVTRQGTGSGSVRLWLNGVEVGTGSAGAPAAPTGDKYIGGSPDDAASTWRGRIDELSLHNKALTAAAIQRLAAGSTCATDGMSWATAFRRLTCAIAEAPGNSEVWIARGLYVPGILSDHTFNVRNYVDLYGGFIGNETTRAQRPAFVAPAAVTVDPAQYTVLSGDLLGNDDPATFANYADNSKHVLTGSGVAMLTRLDGFVLTGGNAGATDQPWASGGGLLNVAGHLTLSNMAFVANTAWNGAGLSHRETDLRLNNVTFLGNHAAGRGGGFSALSSSIYLSNVVFQNNSAGQGGALAVQNGSVKIDNSRFSGNASTGLGGAALMTSVTSAQLTEVTFIDNGGGSGGGLAAQGSTVTINQSKWEGNSAAQGGALYSTESVMQISRATLTANRAESGGAIFRQGGQLTLDATTAAGNTAAQDAGALYLQDGGSVRLGRVHLFANSSGDRGGAVFSAGAADVRIVNSDFVGNSAARGSALFGQDATPALINSTITANSSSSGAAVQVDGASTATLRNTVVWGNAGAAVANSPASSLTLNYSAVEGSGGKDPLFVRPPAPGDGNWGTLADNDYGDLSVQPESPTIDAGDNGALPADTDIDIKGNIRFWDYLAASDTGAGAAPIVDIGAHEFVTSLPYAEANGPYTGVESAPVTVTAQGSGAHVGHIAAYAWDCEGDGVFDLTGDQPTAVCTYPNNGVYTLRLRVQAADDTGVSGGTDEDTALVTISNAPPTYTPPNSQAALVGQTRTFDLGAFADAGQDDQWQIVVDWGDGQISAFNAKQQGAIKLPYSYTKAGQFSVNVRVRDDNGDDAEGVFRVDASRADGDADGDGLLDSQECPNSGSCPDTDGDGIPNYLDPDDDNDGLPTAEELKADSDRDGLPNYLDPDDDNDGVLTAQELKTDSDRDGVANYLDNDDDDDLVPTLEEGTGDLDGDGLADYLDPDDDGDGIPTRFERQDANGNGVRDDREYTYRVLMGLILR